MRLIRFLSLVALAVVAAPLVTRAQAGDDLDLDAPVVGVDWSIAITRFKLVPRSDQTVEDPNALPRLKVEKHSELPSLKASWEGIRPHAAIRQQDWPEDQPILCGFEIARQEDGGRHFAPFMHLAYNDSDKRPHTLLADEDVRVMLNFDVIMSHVLREEKIRDNFKVMHLLVAGPYEVSADPKDWRKAVPRGRDDGDRMPPWPAGPALLEVGKPDAVIGEDWLDVNRALDVNAISFIPRRTGVFEIRVFMRVEGRVGITEPARTRHVEGAIRYVVQKQRIDVEKIGGQHGTGDEGRRGNKSDVLRGRQIRP